MRKISEITGINGLGTVKKSVINKTTISINMALEYFTSHRLGGINGPRCKKRGCEGRTH